MREKNLKQRQTENKKVTLKNIQQKFFRTQLVLIVSLAVMLCVAGITINIHFETKKRDQNLQNVADAIANSSLLTDGGYANDEDVSLLTGRLDTLKEALDDIDVISVVNKYGIRIYHSNHSLINTKYDGNLPEFKESKEYYTVNETGPSGSQRRAYAAIYNNDGEYIGFAMAIMLMKNIKLETVQIFAIFFLITVVALLIELVIAGKLSGSIKKSLMGYEPDVFSAMYKIRDNILETLEEGIIAVDGNGIIQFSNASAARMLCGNSSAALVGQNIDSLGDEILSHTIQNGDKEFNVSLSKNDIILDRVPIQEDDQVAGVIAILHNRAEYTKLMEDLSGARYLVDSMRANNHDFTNKLHVILGLIQMGMYEEATLYIQNITMVQRENISKIMNAVNEPSVAALLIGKIARAAELNVSFVLREGSYYSSADMNLPSGMLVTVIGNLLDNAFDAMNEDIDYQGKKELVFGIYSRPGTVLITVDDTGKGICESDLDLIFENGYSTKGEDRGTGLFQVKSIVENYGGKITVESQEGVGTSFSVSFTKEK
ncbi:MAG: ATP-binding protein [Eubacteriales bacterium]